MGEITRLKKNDHEDDYGKYYNDEFQLPIAEDAWALKWFWQLFKSYFRREK